MGLTATCQTWNSFNAFLNCRVRRGWWLMLELHGILYVTGLRLAIVDCLRSVGHAGEWEWTVVVVSGR